MATAGARSSLSTTSRSGFATCHAHWKDAVGAEAGEGRARAIARRDLDDLRRDRLHSWNPPRCVVGEHSLRVDPDITPVFEHGGTR